MSEYQLEPTRYQQYEESIKRTYHVRDWVEIRREYLRQLAELEARLAASHVDAQQRTDASAEASAANSDQQIERLANQGDVTQ